jgi:hypothetical protein
VDRRRASDLPTCRPAAVLSKAEQQVQVILATPFDNDTPHQTLLSFVYEFFYDSNPLIYFV